MESTKIFEYILTKCKLSKVQTQTEVETVYQYLKSLSPVETHMYDNSGHWTNAFQIVKIDDKYIGCDWAISNNEHSVTTLGWVFNPRSLREMEIVVNKITKISYKKA